MAVPDYETLMLPLLKYIARGECPIQAAINGLTDQFELSAGDRQTFLPSGRTPLINSRVHWAATYLVQSGLLMRPRRGVLRITERGQAVLAENPQRIDNELLIRFPEFRSFRSRSRQPAAEVEPVGALADAAIEEADKQAPEERIEIALSELNTALRAELLDRIRAAPPAFFEHLIVDLMLAMGYGAGGGGSRVGGPNDEGVDGIITEDALGLDTVYLQAKRYAPDITVGIKEIQAFIGALVAVVIDSVRVL